MAQGTRTASPRTNTVSKVSWGAVFAGTAIAVVAQITLLLLGMAIGLFSMGGGVGSFTAYGIGAYIWWAISAIASLFAGGWVTSRFAGLQRSFDGVLHGLVTWAASTILTLFVLTTVVGGLLGGAFSVMGDVASGAGDAISAVTGGDPIETIIGGGREVLDQVREAGGEQAVTEITNAAGQILQDGEISDADRQRIADLLARYTDMSQQQATARVDEWVETAREVQEKARQVAEDVAAALATAALVAFITLLLGAVAAGFGGSIGRVEGYVSV